jgi:ATP-dependent Clp protease ATP-binding subunit ClpB
LNNEDVKKIVMVEIKKLSKRLQGLKINITFDQSVIDFVAKVGFDEVYGARPLKRAIQEKLEDYISDEVLKKNIKEEKPYIIKMVEEDVICEEQIVEKKTKKKKGE